MSQLGLKTFDLAPNSLTSFLFYAFISSNEVNTCKARNKQQLNTKWTNLQQSLTSRCSTTRWSANLKYFHPDVSASPTRWFITINQDIHLFPTDDSSSSARWSIFTKWQNGWFILSTIGFVNPGCFPWRFVLTERRADTKCSGLS